MSRISERNDQRSYDINAVRPFGPVILRAKIPNDFLDYLNLAVDLMLADPKALGSSDWSLHLAGSIEHQLKITEKINDNLEGLRFLITVARTLVLTSSNPLVGTTYPSGNNNIRFTITLDEAWVNEMKAGDYSPLHYHANCQLSCVGYLRNPLSYDSEYMERKESKRSAGCLQFVDGRVAHSASDMFTIKPVVGDLWLFPAWMLHCVYPFKSPGSRRSFSANFSVSLIPEEAQSVNV